MEAFRTGEVVPFWQRRFRAAADARGIAMEGEPFKAVLANITVFARGLVAKGAIAWVEQVKETTAPTGQRVPSG